MDEQPPEPKPPITPPPLPPDRKKIPGSYNPNPLEYRPIQYDVEQQGPGRIVEMIVGCVCYFGVTAIGFLLWRGDFGFSIRRPELVLVPMAILVGLSIYLQGKKGWRGFAPGVLLGFGLSCLVGVGGVIWIVATCKGM